MKQIASFPGIVDGYQIALNAFAHGVRPVEKVHIWQWANVKRWLPASSAGEWGQWKTSRVPYARKPMECLSPGHPARRVVVMASRQVSKTEIGNNMVGHWIEYRTGNLGCVQPTLSLAEKFSKTRLQTMIEGCDTLKTKIGNQKSRDGNNTIFMKSFPGGFIPIMGANSAASLRQMPMAGLFADEIDEYERDIEGQGDVLDILEGAMTTFPFRKIYLCSTPTIESLSRINLEYLASNQERYIVPCPHCDTLQPLEWDKLDWPHGHPKQAVYVCPHCGCVIEHRQKGDMLQEQGYGGRAEWRATFPERESNLVYGFHLNGLYAPLGLGLTWGELAVMYEDAKDDPIKFKTFQNIRLGICSKDPSERIEHHELQARAGGYAKGTVPAGFYMLAGGVDVQKNRVAMIKVAFGPDRAMAFVDYIEVHCDPTDSTELARIIDEWMGQPCPNTRGLEMPVEAWAVDARYLTDDALHYATPRRARVIAVQGHPSPGAPLIASKPRAKHFNWPRLDTQRYHGEIWPIGGHTFNNHFFARLVADRELPPHHRRIQFPGILLTAEPLEVEHGFDEEFYLMLTGEVYDPNKGRWVKSRPRNEAKDCATYAAAAAYQPKWRVHQRPAAWWAARKAKWEPPLDLFSESAQYPAITPVFTPKEPVNPQPAADKPGILANSPRFRRNL
jgi:phage terminase large subunit GpA-like protein